MEALVCGVAIRMTGVLHLSLQFLHYRTLGAPLSTVGRRHATTRHPYSSTPSTIFLYTTSSADSGPAPWTKKKQKISAYSTGSSKLYE